MTLSRSPGNPLDRRLSVAPMMDWTDRFERFFLRQITRHTLLYTEMITAAAIIFGDRDRLLGFDADEHPVALQLGGADPAQLGDAAREAAARGYDEVNLNVGCPSDRVQTGRFGACLMAEPDLVADCTTAMAEAGLPVTVKCRIGIDGRESYDDLADFISRVAGAGVRSFAVHARIAVLEGLSPKQNRDVPPLRYEDVYRLKSENPGLEVAINGGVQNLHEAETHLERLDGVMIGRAAYHDPWMLAEADTRIFGADAPKQTRDDVIAQMGAYAEAHIAAGGRLAEITRHMLGLFQGVPGARGFRRHLAENAHLPGAGPEVLIAAAAIVPEEIRKAPPGAPQSPPIKNEAGRGAGA